jgi:hypothetical protein
MARDAEFGYVRPVPRRIGRTYHNDRRVRALLMIAKFELEFAGRQPWEIDAERETPAALLHEDDVAQVVFRQKYFAHSPFPCHWPHYRCAAKFRLSVRLTPN